VPLQVIGDLGLQTAGRLRPFGQERAQLLDLDEQVRRAFHLGLGA